MSSEMKGNREIRTAYSVTEKAQEESNKLFYDAFKHLTTLSTGSILILIALLEKLFANPRWKALVVVSLICFIISILSSVLMMLFIADAVHNLRGDADKAEDKGFIISTGSFVLGIICFVIFAIRNFFK